MGTGPAESVFGKRNRFIEKRGYKTSGVAMLLKVVLTAQKAYPEVKLQGRDLVQVVGIVASFVPLGAGTRGKFVVSSPRGGKWAQERCAGSPK